MAGSGRGAKKRAGAAAGGGGTKRSAKGRGPAKGAPQAGTAGVAAGRSSSTRAPQAAAPTRPVTGAAPPPAPAAAPRKLPKKKVQRILDDIHQVLASHDVNQPVNVHFTAAAAGPCYQYRLVQDENGEWVYRMVEVPCPGE
jgi:hypothetical protein